MCDSEKASFIPVSATKRRQLPSNLALEAGKAKPSNALNPTSACLTNSTSHLYQGIAPSNALPSSIVPYVESKMETQETQEIQGMELKYFPDEDYGVSEMDETNISEIDDSETEDEWETIFSEHVNPDQLRRYVDMILDEKIISLCVTNEIFVFQDASRYLFPTTKNLDVNKKIKFEVITIDKGHSTGEHVRCTCHSSTSQCIHKDAANILQRLLIAQFAEINKFNCILLAARRSVRVYCVRNFAEQTNPGDHRVVIVTLSQNNFQEIHFTCSGGRSRAQLSTRCAAGIVGKIGMCQHIKKLADEDEEALNFLTPPRRYYNPKQETSVSYKSVKPPLKFSLTEEEGALESRVFNILWDPDPEYLVHVESSRRVTVDHDFHIFAAVFIEDPSISEDTINALSEAIDQEIGKSITWKAYIDALSRESCKDDIWERATKLLERRQLMNPIQTVRSSPKKPRKRDLKDLQSSVDAGDGSDLEDTNATISKLNDAKKKPKKRPRITVQSEYENGNLSKGSVKVKEAKNSLKK
ncbi:hypothetical protein HDU97_009147 [Phlyctochytrium planicorne]|nr:hypothetical protein HDU97_009147 [Phlyctochytrium planicorne]